MTTDLTLDEAWRLLADDPRAVLIDVRTVAEWMFVGRPHLGELENEVRFVEWTQFPSGVVNDQFVIEATVGLDDDQPLLLLCRSGARSAAAAAALEADGIATTHNVVAGFEGDLDDEGHRHGGWKDHLPWAQQ